MSENKKINHNNIVAGIAVAIVLAVVDAYITLLSSGNYLLNALSFIENAKVKELVLWLIQFLVLGISFTAVYFVVKLVYMLVWRLLHKNIWYAGTWVHVHDKENVRTGVVEIKQNFYNLDVTATNIDPLNDRNTITKWRYIGDEILESGNSLIGCYVAVRNEQQTKYGFHIFNNISGKSPNRMEGKFGDVLISNEDVINNADKMGDLYLFKLPKKMMRPYIDNPIRLKDIANDNTSEISKTDFAKRLRKTIDKVDCRKKYDELIEAIEKEPDMQITKQDIEDNLAKVLCKLLLSDKKAEVSEINFLNELLGTSWDISYIRATVNAMKNRSESFEAALGEFIARLDGKKDIKRIFRRLTESAVIGLVRADERIDSSEDECIEKIFALFD